MMMARRRASDPSHPCGIVGCIGNDDFGRVNLERSRSDGVDISAVRVHEEAVTGSASRPPNHGMRSFRWLPQSAPAPMRKCLDFG
jgi:hypothetical protein